MSLCYRPAEQNSDSCSWPLGCFWSVCFFIIAIISYFLYRPLHLPDKVKHMSMFLNTLSPKFYVALTGTSSLISGLILPSLILRYSNGGIFGNMENHLSTSTRTDPLQQQCKVWRNPYSLFRGAEYQRFFRETGRDPLTYYDMNLSAQDHQTFFTCEADAGRPEYELMQMAWRERNHEERIKKTKEALAKNPECATAMILLAEEECSLIVDVSLVVSKNNPAHESMYRRDIHVFVFIRRRLAMCARKLGKLKEAIKMMKDVSLSFWSPARLGIELHWVYWMFDLVQRSYNPMNWISSGQPCTTPFTGKS
ncbi:unnamed protein product [Echinostoma caproni]|uniref:Protein ST7 homolog n=1 Tax=Echinostoma caproni TaxID=27848 RepID=A0A183AYL3_9TREM|nr:unnamed protein product [Echinostoma caproni]